MIKNEIKDLKFQNYFIAPVTGLVIAFDIFLLFFVLIKGRGILLLSNFALRLVCVLLMLLGLVLGTFLAYKNFNFIESTHFSKRRMDFHILMTFVSIMILVILGTGTSAMNLLFSTITIFILGYPFSLIFVYLTHNLKNIKIMATGLVLLILLNPITLFMFSNLFIKSLMFERSIGCGVFITGLSSDSPLVPYDVLNKQLISVNGKNITKYGELYDALATVSVGDNINVLVGNITYAVKPMVSTYTNRSSLGLMVKENKCK